MYVLVIFSKEQTFGIFKRSTNNNVQKVKKYFNWKKFSPQKYRYKSIKNLIFRWEIKSVGGFIFGIGAKNELEFTISSNFTNRKVMRKN